jgi:beta-N-acetylhexosaminidase
VGEPQDADLAYAVGAAVGRECLAAGFNLDFAPVLDVDTNPANPIIGQRAFGTTAAAVIAAAGPFLAGLHASGVLGCGKHFPGHGDTATDSHLELPVVQADPARVRAVELAPFRALAAELPLVMTAHVLFPALDGERPATLSPTIIGSLLRGHCGFRGVVVSDDLEMAGVAGRYSVRERVRLGLEAGVQLFLVCRREDVLAEAVATAAAILAEPRDPLHERAIAALEAIAGLRRRLVRPRPSEGAVREAIGDRRARILRRRLGLGTLDPEGGWH